MVLDRVVGAAGQVPEGRAEGRREAGVPAGTRAGEDEGGRARGWKRVADALGELRPLVAAQLGVELDEDPLLLDGPLPPGGIMAD